MSKTTFLGYVPSLKEKHEAKIVGSKAIESKGGSIRYTIQGLYDGRKTLPKTVSKADFEGVYGFDAKAAESVVIAGKDGTLKGHMVGIDEKDGFTPDVIIPVEHNLKDGKDWEKNFNFTNHADTVGSPSPSTINQPAPSETPFPQEPSNENFSAECENCDEKITTKSPYKCVHHKICKVCVKEFGSCPMCDSNRNFSAEMIECGNCDKMIRTIYKDGSLDIGGIGYCEECYDTLSAENTCAECGEIVADEDIIGDGTNRGLCCVPDYYDEEEVKEAFGFGEDEEEEKEPKNQEFTVVLQEGDKLELTDIEDTEGDVREPKEEDSPEESENEEKEAEHEGMFLVKEIEWDTDGEDVDLPTSVWIPNEFYDDRGGVSNWLSDNYGFLVIGGYADIDTLDWLNAESNTRTFKISDIRYDTYDEETDTQQTQTELELPTEMTLSINLEGDEEDHDIYDILTTQIENQGHGWLVESFEFNAESFSAVSAKVTRPIEPKEEEESDEEGMSTLTKVGLGVGAVAVGLAVLGAEDEGESDYWSSENNAWRAEYVSDAETFEASKHHGKSKKQRGKAVIHSRGQTNRSTQTDSEWSGVNDRNKKNLQGQTDIDNVNRAEGYETVLGQRVKIGSKKHQILTSQVKHFNDLESNESFEARTTRKSFHNPITDESHDETASAKMIATPDGLHNTRRYERDSRNKKGHKRLSNPKKMDWDNADLSQDFTKTKQREKEDLRNIKKHGHAETFEAESEPKNIKMALGITAIGIGLAAVLGKDKITKLFDRFGL